MRFSNSKIYLTNQYLGYNSMSNFRVQDEAFVGCIWVRMKVVSVVIMWCEDISKEVHILRYIQLLIIHLFIKLHCLSHLSTKHASKFLSVPPVTPAFLYNVITPWLNCYSTKALYTYTAWLGASCN